MEDTADQTSNPIWHSPAWITAIVGLISVFFTVPDVVGNYLSKQQEIDLAQKNVALAELKNQDLEKTNQFKTLVTVLNHRAEDRAITLRFIAATSDAPSVKAWAERELELQSQRRSSDAAQRGVPADAAAPRH